MNHLSQCFWSKYLFLLGWTQKTYASIYFCAFISLLPSCDCCQSSKFGWMRLLHGWGFDRWPVNFTAQFLIFCFINVIRWDFDVQVWYLLVSSCCSWHCLSIMWRGSWRRVIKYSFILDFFIRNEYSFCYLEGLESFANSLIIEIKISWLSRVVICFLL